MPPAGLSYRNPCRAAKTFPARREVSLEDRARRMPRRFTNITLARSALIWYNESTPEPNIRQGVDNVDSRVAVISIIVEKGESVNELNELLHKYSDAIIGRMGIPYRERSINIISIAIDAPQTVIAGLSGKIGNLVGVSAKVAYSNV